MTEEMKSLIDHLGAVRRLDMTLKLGIANTPNSAKAYNLTRTRYLWEQLSALLGVDFEPPKIVNHEAYCGLVWRSPKGYMLQISSMGPGELVIISENINEDMNPSNIAELAQIIQDHFPWEP